MIFAAGGRIAGTDRDPLGRLRRSASGARYAHAPAWMDGPAEPVRF